MPKIREEALKFRLKLRKNIISESSLPGIVAIIHSVVFWLMLFNNASGFEFLKNVVKVFWKAEAL